METRANYLMVGGFVLALAAGLVVFVLWLAKLQLDTEFARYDILYKGSVTGLRAGSPVRYSGVRVGEVISLGLDPDRPERVRVTIEVEATTPIRTDTAATLEIEGLTGGRYVLLSGASTESPPLVAAPGQPRPVIASRSSSLQQVLEGAPEVVQSVNLLLARANDLLNAENRGHVAAGLANFDQFTGALADHREDIGTLIRDASASMANLRGATAALEEMAQSLKVGSARLAERADTTLASIDSMAGSIDRSVGETATGAQKLIADLRITAQKLAGTSAQLGALVAENRAPIRDFTSNGLYEFTTLLTEMRELVVSLNRVTTEVQRDPARFLFGDQQQGYEAR
ncbi:MAG: MlaD family protein [Kiloniellaceae bacterium]